MRPIILLLFVMLFGCQESQVRPILTDGKISAEEWQDAQKIVLDDRNDMYLKSDQFYYYIALKSSMEKPIYYDMFFEISGELVNVHASSQLGDRVLPDTSWTDQEPKTRWGFNQGWVANTVKFDREKLRQLRAEGVEGDLFQQTLLPYDGMEFQFSKEAWQLENALVRVEVRGMTSREDFKEGIFPADSKRKDTANWHQLSW